ncbi:hypothetical protein SAMN05421810_104141 [Amycolatopsis arida]|uniref:Uncharacterized protein n=1 Tax=Amycolatopsis arida TaxID=587909 RepID=A0A1I5UXY9_9PSEU|nr:hypothetical protein [Amycolatopsis arida]TDX91060.1 hypothetical protein CLV69_106140 [Amycolatopsis arida]SFP99576.1 hypothetical protein SAMN05421810_104141 [Amycolatopsis arida]
MNELVRLWRRAVTAELCWLRPSGEPAAVAVTPLTLDGAPCVALPYARAAEIADLGAAGEAVFAVTDSRSLPPRRAGAAAAGRIDVTDDTTGEVFAGELLDQELRKYPPSRVLADSPLLRRENWWWLPRIVVRLAHAHTVTDLPARTNPRTQALVVHGHGGAPAVRTASVRDGGQRVGLRPLAAGDLPAGGPALVFGYDYSMPDLERWECWSRYGTLDGAELTVTRRHGDPDAELGPLPLLRRIQRRRDLGRGCRRGIAAAERAATP